LSIKGIRVFKKNSLTLGTFQSSFPKELTINLFTRKLLIELSSWWKRSKSLAERIERHKKKKKANS
jgi:hypothetical protein